MLDGDGDLDLDSGWTNDIHLLRPGKENAITIDTYVGIHPDADPITTNEARCELRFSHPDARISGNHKMVSSLYCWGKDD